jgi:hypothetical protein
MLQEGKRTQAANKIDDANPLSLGSRGWILKLAADKGNDACNGSRGIGRAKELV